MSYVQESSYRVVSTSASDYEDDSHRVLDSFKAATSLLSAMAETSSTQVVSPSVESWTKTAVTKLKTTSVTEKNELQRLNSQLQTYLENVKRLEALNRALMAEVEKAKVAYAPKIMDKSGLNSNLSSIRSKLEEESMACVRFQTRIEANQILTSHITDRIKFFHQEAEVYKQKLYSLQTYLNEMNQQKEFLKRNAKLAEEEIGKEQARILQTEKELEGMLEKLKESRLRNKKLEFEMQTLLDEISFVKAVFNEELADLRSRLSHGTAFSGTDISSFFKNELTIAVRQIREDFKNLNEHQLAEYRQLKELELQSNISIIEQEKAHLAKLTASKDIEMQSVKELSARLEENKADLSTASSRNYELSQKLTGLEIKIKDIKAKFAMELDRKQAEIETLRMQNDQYASELEYWNRVTRTKLESEIQTYRSILNSQIKLLETVTNNFVITQKLTEEVIKPVVNTKVTETVISTGGQSLTTNTSSSHLVTSGSSWTIPEKVVTTTKVTAITQEEKDRNEVISVLRQVFEYFDADKSGRINSNEFDQILSKLNVKLSREAYQKMLRENDLDMSRDIDFNEFLRIMLPVFSGKFEDEQLYYAFKKFDTNGTGYISIDELKELLAKIGQNFSERDIARMIASVDRDGDGRLNFQEFVRLMRTPASVSTSF